MTAQEHISRIKTAYSALKPDLLKPWVKLDKLPYIHATDDPNAKPYSGPVVGRFDYMESADYILACNPEAMSSVLTHIDAQAAEIERLEAESEERLQNCAALVAEVEKLRAAPATAPERKQITVDEIVSLAYDCNALPEVITDVSLIRLCRALEAFHGITGEKP